MKIKAVIFDVDGVLVDTVPYHFEAWRKMFEGLGVKFTFDDYVKKVNGLPRNTGIKNVLPEIGNEELELLASLKQHFFLDAFKKQPPRPMKGVVAFLKLLKKTGIITAAASSSKNSPFVLNQMGLAGYMKTIVSGHDFQYPKPHPEIFLTAAENIEIPPENCMVIEDALAGVQAAVSGGMYCVGLLTSNDTKIIEEAHLTVNSLKEYDVIYNQLMTCP